MTDISDERLQEFLDQVDRDDFAAAVNSTFRVNEIVDVKLIEVSELKPFPRQSSFSMLFLFPLDIAPVQGVYRFDHPTLGTHDIFVVPIEKARDGIVFEAVFNRLIPRQ